MTIQQFSVNRRVSKGTIYNRIRKSKFTLSQITNGNGDITTEGLTILNSFFPETEIEPAQETELDNADNLRRDQEELQRIRDALKESQGNLDRLQGEITILKDNLRRAEARADQWEQRYFELQDKAERERAEYRQQVTEAHRLISQEQEIKHVSILKRLFAGKQRETVTAESQVK